MVNHMAPTTNKDKLDVELDEAGIQARGTQLGEMAIGFERWPVGDYTNLFDGLPHGCQAAHYGYVLKGRAILRYADGSEETAEAGDVYYAKPGHSFRVEEEFEVVEFTPADGVYEQTMKVFEKNLPGFLRSLQAEV